MAEVLGDLRAFIAHRMREGFESVHEIIANATDYAFDKYDGKDLHAEIRQIAVELFAAHRAEQATWEEQTDCDS